LEEILLLRTIELHAATAVQRSPQQRPQGVYGFSSTLTLDAFQSAVFSNRGTPDL